MFQEAPKSNQDLFVDVNQTEKKKEIDQKKDKAKRKSRSHKEDAVIPTIQTIPTKAVVVDKTIVFAEEADTEEGEDDDDDADDDDEENDLDASESEDDTDQWELESTFGIVPTVTPQSHPKYFEKNGEVLRTKLVDALDSLTVEQFCALTTPLTEMHFKSFPPNGSCGEDHPFSKHPFDLCYFNMTECAALLTLTIQLQQTAAITAAIRAKEIPTTKETPTQTAKQMQNVKA